MPNSSSFVVPKQRGFWALTVLALVFTSSLTVAKTARAADAPSPVGLWRITDGPSKEPVSLIAIAWHEGKLKGTVMRVMRSSQGEHPICQACKGALKDKAVVGMTILWDLTQEQGKPVWSGGSVLDPAIGQTYRCKLTLKDENTLEVRGYLGISLLGRSQTWKRAQPAELTAPLPSKAPAP